MGFAWRAKVEALEPVPHHEREAIVELSHLHIARRDLRPLEQATRIIDGKGR